MCSTTLYRWIAIVAMLAHGATAECADVSFLRDVAPILLTRCSGCHGPNKAEGDFRLHVFESLRKPGASTERPVVAGQPQASALFARISTDDVSLRMPQQDDPLSTAEIELVRRWIAEGAKFDGHDMQKAIRSQMPPRDHPRPPEIYRSPIPIFALDFSPDGHELAVGGHHEITVWNAETGSLLRRLAPLPLRIHAVIHTSGRPSLFVAGGSPGEYGEVAEIDPLTGDRRRVFGTFDDVVLDLALSHDGRRLVAASADRSVRLFTVDDGRLQWQSQLHFDAVTCAAFSHDDRFVATGSRDFTIKVLDTDTGALFTTYLGHKAQFGKEAGRFEVLALAFANKSPLAFSAGAGQSIRVWEPERARDENGSAADMELRFFKAGHTQYLPHPAAHGVSKLVVSGDQLFAATGDGTVKQYDISALKPVRDFTGHHGRVFALAAHSATQRIVSAAHDGEVRVWDTGSGAMINSFTAAPGFVPRGQGSGR